METKGLMRMKYEVSSLNTKKTLAASLKKLMRKKPLSRVTVSEIVRDCGMNRNTFYYHFEDIYALLKWMLDQETVEVIRQIDLVIDYEEAILYVLRYIGENDDILNNIYHSLGNGELRRFFVADFAAIIRTIIEKGEELEGLACDPQFKDFLCGFYIEATAGTLLEWVVSHGTKIEPQRLVEYISLIFKNSIIGILHGAQEGGLAAPKAEAKR